MIRDFEDLVIWMFVTIDDVWQQIGDQYQRPGPAPERCSDSELITIAIVSELRGWDLETQLATNWAPYRHLFPHLPERSRFNRRRRNLWLAINAVRRRVLATLDIAQDGQGIIDSLPLPIMTFHLAPQRDRTWDAEGATFGYCASKKETFFGFRLHLLVTLGGLILDFELTSATGDERVVADALLRDRGHGTYLGDKGYVDDALAQTLWDESGVRLVTLRRKNQHHQLPEATRRMINQVRQTIETVNSQLAGQLRIQINYAVTFWGLCARLYTKLAAHTLCIALNRWLGDPDWLRIAHLTFPSSASTSIN